MSQTTQHNPLFFTLITLAFMLVSPTTAKAQSPTPVTSLSNIGTSGDYIIENDIDASGFTTSIGSFSGTLTAQAKGDGTFPIITNLSVPIFTTATDATISNLMFKNIHVSGSGPMGTIAGTANGTTKIYNCGILPSNASFTEESSTVASNNGNCGSLVGTLAGSARVVNSFSYATITGGTTVAGIVGNNTTTSITQDNYSTVGMVVNCMFYGEITGGSTKRPVYGGNMIKNETTKKVNNVTVGIGVNPYCFFRGSATFDDGYGNIDNYNRSWPADEEYLTRFEYYRSILNSNRQLMAWWVSGSIADTALIAKWVLDPSIAPYPILKKWGKYPSIINPDPTRTWDPEANSGAGGWQTRSSATSYRGKSFGTLSVTVNAGGHHAGTGTTTKSLPLTITDMDTLNYDYGYYKVQLPYYNEVFGNPASTDHDTRYGGNYKDYVVTGWKITSITGGTQGTFSANWESGYNFADRNCTDKDKYDVSGRVFAQGGFFYVPEGVSSITIEAYWGKAVYLHNAGHYLDRVNITNESGDRKVGSPFSPAGTLSSSFQGQTVYDVWHTAVTNLDAATKTGDNLNKTVYDQAVVLLSNFQLKNGNGKVGVDDNHNNKWYPYTIMSIDQDLDNEPDYCFELQFRRDFSRPAIQPIRFDFLPVPELGMAVRHNTQQNAIGILVPQGHFEITETSFMRTTQFEYDGANTRVASPVILNGGNFEQIVVRYGPQNKTLYFIMGGHFRMRRFTPGAHTARKQSAKVRLCAVNAIGGDFPEFYLSGIYRPDIVPESVTKQGNPHCYTNGGHFGLIAGSGYDKILGSVTFMVDHSIIDEFYGGGINGANPVGGDINVTIDHSLVGKYCGGPKVGAMTSSVITHALGTTFGRYYGGGNGGTSYYREQGYDGNDYNTPADSAGWAVVGVKEEAPAGYTEFNPLNTRTGTNVPVAFNNVKGYHALYEFECFVESNGLGGKPTLRTYTHWAQFGTTSTGNTTNILNNCIIEKNFYGGGNLGNVNGNVTSTLTGCTVKGNAFAAGFSGTIEPFCIHDKSSTVFPYIDKGGLMHNGTLSYLQNTDGTDRYYTWCYKNAHGQTFPAGVTIPVGVTTSSPTFFQTADGKWYVLTTVSLEGLGAVSGNATLTIIGGTVGTQGDSNTGNVYGGGDESAVNGNTTVILEEGTHVLGNVYGGGNEGPVGGNSEVKIQN